MRQEARVATVNAPYGAVSSAANGLRLNCRLTPSRNPNVGYGIDMAVEISKQYSIVYNAGQKPLHFALPQPPAQPIAPSITSGHDMA